MRTSNFPVLIALGVALAGTVTPAGARPLPPSTKWGVILRNTTGEPTAALRGGPYGRSGPSRMAATVPPPYGRGSLGILVGSLAEKINFGNETIFGGLPLRDIHVLKYWIYAGQDVPSVASLPIISIEANPRSSGIGYTSLNYGPANSSPPSRPPVVFSNTWQQYDASGPARLVRLQRDHPGGDRLHPGHPLLLRHPQGPAAERHRQPQHRHQRRPERDLRGRGGRTADQQHGVRLRAVRRPPDRPQAVVGPG